MKPKLSELRFRRLRRGTFSGDTFVSDGYPDLFVGKRGALYVSHMPPWRSDVARLSDFRAPQQERLLQALSAFDIVEEAEIEAARAELLRDEAVRDARSDRANLQRICKAHGVRVPPDLLRALNKACGDTD